MKLTPEEVDELLNDGLMDPPKNFTDSVMASIEADAPTVDAANSPLLLKAMRAIALMTGVGIGVGQMVRFVLGIYFVGALN